jgi:hypothetical protein
MSNILEFRVPHSSSRTTATGGGDLKAAAKIVIFPGVRYERMSEPVQPAPEPAATKRGRRKSSRRSLK